MASVTDAVNVERHKVTVPLMVIVLYHIIYLSLQEPLKMVSLEHTSSNFFGVLHSPSLVIHWRIL